MAGPNGVLENLQEQVSALTHSKTGKPFEPNIIHHFSFREETIILCVICVPCGYSGKEKGIPYIIIQTMLNISNIHGGIQDLAKSRALLNWQGVREPKP